jgi:anti-sigma regulatory factor (Ser/Thr protein kinase)
MEQFLDSAKKWLTNNEEEIPSEFLYFQNSADFRVGLDRLTKQMVNLNIPKEEVAIISAVVGEIGNNSFDHNLGNWPNQPGILFVFDEKKRTIVIADRGLGVLTTLKKIRPKLASYAEALKVAFSEVVTSRAPEPRGNGLKFVRQVVASQDFILDFYSGSASIHLDDGLEPIIKETNLFYHGCLAVFYF